MKKLLNILFVLLLVLPLYGQSSLDNPIVFTPYLYVPGWISTDSLYARAVVISSTLDLSGTISGDLDVAGKLVVADSARVEKTLRVKGATTFGATATSGTLAINGKITSPDTVVAVKGFRTEDISRLKGTVTYGATATSGTLASTGKITSPDTIVSTKGIRTEGTSRLKGAATFGATATPTVISTNGAVGIGATANGTMLGLRINSIGATLDQTKSILLENQTAAAAAAGAQQMSPALVFRGNGWKTDATAGSDSVKWAIYNLPSQGTSAPNTRLYFDYKIGTGSWINSFYSDPSNAIYTSGNITSLSQVLAGLQIRSDILLARNNGNPVSIKNYSGTTIMSLLDGGSVGIGTTAPGAKLEVKGAAMGSVSTDTLLSVFNDRYGAATRDSSFNVLANGNLGINGAVQLVRVVSLTDGAQYLLPTGVAGFGQVKATGAWCFFHFAADGTVTLEDHVSGSTTEDNDTTLNVFDDGSGIGIENELGSTLNVLIDITYYTP